MRPLTFLDISPRFALGRFPSERALPTVVSMPTFLRLSGNAYARLQDIPMSSCIIRLKDGASNKAVAALAADLKEWVATIDFQLWDLRKTSSALDQSNAVMALIFSAATYIAIFLCLFSLVASMLTNILEQSKVRTPRHSPAQTPAHAHAAHTARCSSQLQQAVVDAVCLTLCHRCARARHRASLFVFRKSPFCVRSVSPVLTSPASSYTRPSPW